MNSKELRVHSFIHSLIQQTLTKCFARAGPCSRHRRYCRETQRKKMKQNCPTLASTELMYSWLCVRQQVSNLSQVTLSSMEKEPHVLQERTSGRQRGRCPFRWAVGKPTLPRKRVNKDLKEMQIPGRALRGGHSG